MQTCAIFHAVFVTINCSANTTQYNKTDWFCLKMGKANLSDKIKVSAFHSETSFTA